MSQDQEKFVLNITMKGSCKKAMRAKLLELAAQFDTPYGKPLQGTSSQFRVETKVLTPVWDGKEF